MHRVRVRTTAQSDEYEIKIAPNALREIGTDARRWIGDESRRIAVVSNDKVFGYYGARVLRSLKASKFDVLVFLVPDGERHKTLTTVERILKFLSDHKFGRTDAVVALGGGVAGDIAGFSASVFMRGIPFINAPTTLLSQIDASVGGKTGVNLETGKNLVGAFHQPSGVVADLTTLKTLPKRELIAGCCEMVKQGAVSGRQLFKQTTDFLKDLNSHPRALESIALEKLVAAQCEFKRSIVVQDERESTRRNDRRSRKILNFGHTVGHALEAVTGYRRYRHGEAVGVGMIAAGEISKNLGMLPDSELKLLIDGIRMCGPLPRSKDVPVDAILNSIRNDKKNVAGDMQWVLLERIGKPRIVSGKEISSQLLKRSVRDALLLASTLRN